MRPRRAGPTAMGMIVAVGVVGLFCGADGLRPPRVGYTEFRTDLPGGRHVNVATMRAAIVEADGTGRRSVAPELAGEPDSWTQFAGWSPDGRRAIVGRGWESPENARWEEEHRTF